jgi:O-antigen/teichoic acid export membrane protein
LASVGTAIASSAVAARLFTAEEFGFWVILQSILLLGQNMDLGLRYGLANRLAAISSLPAVGQRIQTHRTYQAVFNCLIYIGFAGALLSLFAVIHLPWVRWLSIKQLDLAENGGPLVAKVFTLLFLTLPGSLVSTVYFAKQKILSASLVTVANSAILLAVFISSALVLPFQYTVLLYFLSNLAFSIVSTWFLWRKERWRWIPLRVVKQWLVISEFLVPSIRFFGLTMAVTISGVIGTFVSGNVFGLVVAGHFSALQRIFNVLNILHLAILGPVGPKYTSLARSEKWPALKKQHRNLLLILWPLIFMGVGGAVWLLHPLVLKLWTGLDIEDYGLGCIIWTTVILQGWVNAHSILLNSLGIVGFQAAYTVLMITPSIMLPYYLSRSFGSNGIALGALVCILPAALVWPIVTRRVLRLRTMLV